MSKPRPIYRTDGTWVAVLSKGNLYDTQGEWIAWLDGGEVYSLEGEFVGTISADGRLLRPRVVPYRKRRRAPEEYPPYEPLPTIPLPPMFAEIPFSLIDVFEEMPEIFAVIGELRPDAGEKVLPRLVELDPALALRKRLHKVEQELLEELVYGMIYSYRVIRPPVPVEAMAAGAAPEQAVEITVVSPEQRLALSEGLIERLSHSSWTVERGYCGPEGFTRPQIEYAARALLLPRHWLLRLPAERRHPSVLARRYLVPQDAVVLRLHDLA
jgi:hypothetical protein